MYSVNIPYLDHNSRDCKPLLFLSTFYVALIVARHQFCNSNLVFMLPKCCKDFLWQAWTYENIFWLGLGFKDHCNTNGTLASNNLYM